MCAGVRKEFNKSELNRNGDRRGMHPNSRKNLKPGKGRPRNEFSITSKQREMLPLPCPYCPGKTWLEWLADRGMALACENATYYRELLDRLEGKVMQPIGGNGEPITLRVIYERTWNKDTGAASGTG